MRNNYIININMRDAPKQFIYSWVKNIRDNIQFTPNDDRLTVLLNVTFFNELENILVITHFLAT